MSENSQKHKPKMMKGTKDTFMGFGVSQIDSKKDKSKMKMGLFIVDQMHWFPLQTYDDKVDYSRKCATNTSLD